MTAEEFSLHGARVLEIPFNLSIVARANCLYPILYMYFLLNDELNWIEIEIIFTCYEDRFNFTGIAGGRVWRNPLLSYCLYPRGRHRSRGGRACRWWGPHRRRSSLGWSRSCTSCRSCSRQLWEGKWVICVTSVWGWHFESLCDYVYCRKVKFNLKYRVRIVGWVTKTSMPGCAHI